MGSVLDNLLHRQFDDWFVFARGESRPGGPTLWWCRCKCSVERLIPASNLKRRMTRACLGCSLVRRHGYVLVGPPKPKADRGGAPSPVTAEQEAEIVCRYRAGESRNALANEYGASRQFVEAAVRRAGFATRNIKEACPGLPARHDAFADAANDREAAYWCGMLMTDGCVGENRGVPCVILSLSSRDVRHVEAFRRFLGAEHAICRTSSKDRVIEGGVLDGHHIRSGEAVRLAVNSERMASDLARYGIVPRKTYTAEAKRLESSPDFWRGAIDGDGSVGFRTRGKCKTALLQFCGTEMLVKQFLAFAKGVVETKAEPYPDKRSDSLWCVQLQTRKASDVVRVLYANGGTALARKASRAVEMLRRADERLARKSAASVR